MNHRGVVINKNKVNNIIIIGILLITVILCMFISNINNKYKSKLENRVITDDTELVKIENIEEFQKLSNGIIYFGKDSCSSCQTIEPILQEIVKEKHLQIYYFNTDYFRKELNVPENELQEIFNKYKILSVPAIIELKNGNLEKSNIFRDVSENGSSSLKRSIIDSFEAKSMEDMPSEKYPMQNIVTICLFIISLLFFVIFLLLKQQIELQNLWFITLLISICFIVVLFFSTKSYIAYLDITFSSGNTFITTLTFISVILNLFIGIKSITFKMDSNK